MSEIARDIARVFDLQRRHKHIVRRTTAAERVAKLERLRDSLKTHAQDLMAALGRDTGKPPLEAFIELTGPLGELNDVCPFLEEWMKPDEVVLGPNSLPGARGQIVQEPKGQVLIFGPWNFPSGLLFQPLVGAIAAGNVCMLKPSELTPATSALSLKIVRELFPEEEVAIFEGGPEVAQLLLQHPFDHIFFTGSTKVGKLVMAAAATHLSSVTLELGGKSPAIVDSKVDLPKIARRIAWGKFANAGQVCLSPDHVYVPKGLRDAFVAEVRAYLNDAYYKDGQFNTGDLAQIVDDRNLKRLTGLISDATARGAKVVQGGHLVGERRLAPTIVVDVPADAGIMQEEIFGPIMPVIAYDDLEDVLDQVNDREKPLALYVFSEDSAFVDKVLTRTSSGGATVNDVIRHVTEPTLPFGGAGPSGHGSYHGKYSFLAFSHTRSVYLQSSQNSPMEGITRPPFAGKLEAILGAAR
ncbi:MAG TPA: aldehyde dehydrogenase family protein [Steroidobacteraceae bacterium]|jgi:aldehyde dehydrogenase (NAD+)